MLNNKGDSLNTVNLLLTSAGGEGFVDTHQAFKKNKERTVYTVATDVDAEAIGLYVADCRYVVSKRTSPSFKGEILDICKKEKIHAIYPLSTFDQPIFAEWRDEFLSRGITVVVSNKKSIDIANSKMRLYSFLTGKGISLPRFGVAYDFDELKRLVFDMGYPEKIVVLKQDKGTGGQGLRLLDASKSEEEIYLQRDFVYSKWEYLSGLAANSKAIYPIIVSEYLPGREYSVDVLCHMRGCLVSVVRSRIKTFRGMTLVGEVISNKKLTELATKVSSMIGLEYVANMQFKLRESGEPVLIEVNPRIPGTVGLTVAAGVNMPYLALKLALGEKICIPHVKTGVKVIKYWCSMFKK